MFKLDIKLNTAIYDFMFSHDISNKHLKTRALAEIVDTQSGKQIGEISPLENLHSEKLSFAIKEFIFFSIMQKQILTLKDRSNFAPPFSTLGIQRKL